MQKKAIPMHELTQLLTLQLENGGRAELTVTGYSMRPMLRDRRDSVTLVPVMDKQKPGDVILYRRENGQYVLHRIIGVNAEGYICSGDNQAMREPVAHSQLIAVMEAFTRGGRVRTVRDPVYRVYSGACVRLFFARGCYIAVRRKMGKGLSKLSKAFNRKTRK